MKLSEAKPFKQDKDFINTKDLRIKTLRNELNQIMGWDVEWKPTQEEKSFVVGKQTVLDAWKGVEAWFRGKGAKL